MKFSVGIMSTIIFRLKEKSEFDSFQDAIYAIIKDDDKYYSKAEIDVIFTTLQNRAKYLNIT